MAAKSYVDEMGGDQSSRRGPERAKFDLGEYVLTLMALTFLTTNTAATHRLRTKILEFLEYVDDEQYADSSDIRWRLALARAVGRAVLRSGARALPAVEHRALEDTEWADWHAAFFDAYRNGTGHAAEGCVIENELSDEDIKYVDGYVSTRLRYSYLWSHRAFFHEVSSRVDTGDMGGSVEEFNEKVITGLERLVQRGRQARFLGTSEAQDFRTGTSSFEAAIRAAHAARNRPQSVVRTGVRLLNDMLGGGYEGGRVYVHFGRSGDWKSGMLCSAAFWACDARFNPTYVTKDPTRKPCVLFITQENDLYETIERMISFSLGSHIDLRGATVEELVRLLEEAYSSETCHFSFKYRKSRTITTAHVEEMVYDEFMAGYEVVAIIHDYIKRLKAVEAFKDQRHLELGAVVDEESSIAKALGVPFITGMQLTRAAYAKFEAAVQSGRADAVKQLGASEAGESINVFENADVVIFQGRVTSEALDGRMFLTCRRGKMRGKSKGGTEFFAQPYELDENGNTNEMKLTEDAHLTPQECKGLKDVGDGLQQMYDPNGDAAGGSSAEERRADREAAVLSSAASAQPRRKGRGGQPARRVVPEAATATVAFVADADDLPNL